jgi:hypothetical protein
MLRLMGEKEMTTLWDYVREFDHFVMPKNGAAFINLWSAEECESCGNDCEAPNSAQVGERNESGVTLTKSMLLEAGLTERDLSDSAGELGHSDEFGGAVCPDCYDYHLNKDKPYEWTVKFKVHPKWVADGIDLSKPERLYNIMMHKLGYFRPDDLEIEVLESPDPLQIRAEHGEKVEGYKARDRD